MRKTWYAVLQAHVWEVTAVGAQAWAVGHWEVALEYEGCDGSAVEAAWSDEGGEAHTSILGRMSGITRANAGVGSRA